MSEYDATGQGDARDRARELLRTAWRHSEESSPALVIPVLLAMAQTEALIYVGDQLAELRGEPRA